MLHDVYCTLRALWCLISHSLLWKVQTNHALVGVSGGILAGPVRFPLGTLGSTGCHGLHNTFRKVHCVPFPVQDWFWWKAWEEGGTTALPHPSFVQFSATTIRFSYTLLSRSARTKIVGPAWEFRGCVGVTSPLLHPAEGPVRHLALKQNE